VTVRTAFFVQFPHPKDEPPPSAFVTVRQDQSELGNSHALAGRLIMPWNTTKRQHFRKFLISPGRYVLDGSAAVDGEMVFWGEWEPPSEIATTWPTNPNGRLPRNLHRPFWSRPATVGLQNTDPWVWGDCMIYSNCKQAQVSLRRLTRGSVICFGSTFGDEFCADTVMVIASAEPWDPHDLDGLDASGAFHTCTGETVAGDPSCGPDADLILYRGATFEEPVDGMYSFVPAMLVTSPLPRFARPPVRLPGLINTTSTRGPRGAPHPLPYSQVQQAWESLRRQVMNAGLVLGVHLETPRAIALLPQ
jgi:hypothetical protein